MKSGHGVKLDMRFIDTSVFAVIIIIVSIPLKSGHGVKRKRSHDERKLISYKVSIPLKSGHGVKLLWFVQLPLRLL